LPTYSSRKPYQPSSCTSKQPSTHADCTRRACLLFVASRKQLQQIDWTSTKAWCSHATRQAAACCVPLRPWAAFAPAAVHLWRNRGTGSPRLAIQGHTGCFSVKVLSQPGSCTPAACCATQHIGCGFRTGQHSLRIGQHSLRPKFRRCCVVIFAAGALGSVNLPLNHCSFDREQWTLRSNLLSSDWQNMQGAAQPKLPLARVRHTVMSVPAFLLIQLTILCGCCPCFLAI